MVSHHVPEHYIVPS